MSSGSESDEFFDAPDTTPVRSSRPKPATIEIDPKEPLTLNSRDEDENLPIKEQQNYNQKPFPHVTSEEIKEAERKVKEIERRRRKVEEMRRRLNDDDEVIEQSSGQSSMTSSIEGVILSSPSQISVVEKIICTKGSNNSDDVQSVISLGKVGCILGDKDTVSVDSKDSSTFQSHVTQNPDSGDFDIPLPSQENKDNCCPEPDVVASTKGDRPEAPVPPPRRKKKNNPPSVLEPKAMPLKIIDVPQGLPSPTPVRDLEHSLDLPSATRGQYVVKPQDREQDRAEGPPSTPEQTILPSKMDSLEKISPRNSGNRRAADEIDMKKEVPAGNKEQQSNMVMRTRSDSGRPLSDLEILEQVKVLNLDTGEQIPLSKAEEQLPKCINPLSLHIMRLTSEYVNTSDLDKDRESEEESTDNKKSLDTADGGNVWKPSRLISKTKKNIGKTLQKLINAADEVYHARHNEEVETSEEEADAQSLLKVKSSTSHKGPSEFDGIKLVQELSAEHSGAVWTMKFSSCGRLLATAGQDRLLIIWVLRDSYSFFDDMRQKYNAEAKVSPTPSQESLVSQQSEEAAKNGEVEGSDDSKSPFMAKPFCIYEGHTADLLDVSWSKNYFILSSSMDKTVRLWHISRRECLCCFQHIDFVTAIAFHPKDDRYFLSGSLDGKLRLWNIPDKKVALWNELDGQTKLITAVSFCQNGKFAVVGCYDGRCIFYNTEQLKYYTQIHVRSTRGKNAQGRKISGIEPMPGEDKVLVTSNDSRIRLYDLRDLSLSCKYKGYVNLSSQIKATFSHDGKYIISGSENQFIYIWKTHHDYSKFSSARRDRNDYWEGIKAHNAVVTSAVFAPNPGLILRQLEQAEQNIPSSAHAVAEVEGTGYVIISADFNGAIKVFINKPKSKSAVNSIVGLIPPVPH